MHYPEALAELLHIIQCSSATIHISAIYLLIPCYSKSISSLILRCISILFRMSIVFTSHPLKLQFFINSSILFTPYISLTVTTTPNLSPIPSLGSSLLFVYISNPQFLFFYAVFGMRLSLTFSEIYLTLSHFLKRSLASPSSM